MIGGVVEAVNELEVHFKSEHITDCLTVCSVEACLIGDGLVIF